MARAHLYTSDASITSTHLSLNISPSTTATTSPTFHKPCTSTDLTSNIDFCFRTLHFNRLSSKRVHRSLTAQFGICSASALTD